LAVFRDLGATIRGVEPPPMQLFNDAKKIIAIAELYSIHEKDLKTRPELFGASLRYRIIAGGLVRAEDYVQAMRVRRDLASAMQQIFTTIDLMMLPTGEPAGKLEPVPHYTLFTDPSYTRHSTSAAIRRCRCAAAMRQTACRNPCRSPAGCSRTRLCCARVTPMKWPRPGVIGGLH
jgi:aspartyl-tRNA(Asn)/glutamyl-tRNA(Gln) amidotransferase subunit A